MSRAQPEVTALAGAERLVIRGRAAVLIGLIARAADRINAIAIGRVVGHLANGKIHLELRVSGEVVRLDD